VRRMATVTALIVLVAAAGMLVLTGCDSAWYEDDWDDDWRDDGSYNKTIYFYLNVADAGGDPLPGVTVWIDGEQQEARTDDEYERLGQQFPPDWRGWRYNWDGGPFWVNVQDCPGGECTFEIMVTRPGLQSQRSYVTFNRWDPREIYVRQTFVMEPRVGVRSAEVITAPQRAEKCSLEQ